MKHFTLLELATDSESPMIGTIDNIPPTEQGMQSFKERFSEALMDHYDVTEFFADPIPDLIFTGSPYQDIEVVVDGITEKARILETWMY